LIGNHQILVREGFRYRIIALLARKRGLFGDDYFIGSYMKTAQATLLLRLSGDGKARSLNERSIASSLTF